MDMISLIALGAALFLFLGGKSKDDKEDAPVDNNEDLEFNVDDDHKPSFVCLIKKWQDLKDCAAALDLEDAVKQLDTMWPSFNKKERF